jgi:hypothetical protein
MEFAHSLIAISYWTYRYFTVCDNAISGEAHATLPTIALRGDRGRR